jgi:hypothetical protein
MPFLNDPKHWRQLAEEALTIADKMTDLQAKLSITSVADRLCQATDRSALIVHKGQRQYRD